MFAGVRSANTDDGAAEPWFGNSSAKDRRFEITPVQSKLNLNIVRAKSSADAVDMINERRLRALVVSTIRHALDPSPPPRVRSRC